MIKRMYSVFDRKVTSYNPGHAYEHEEQAVRTFISLFRGEPNLISQYPEDFEFRFIGEFDSSTGKIDQSMEDFASTVITGIEACRMARRLDEKEMNLAEDNEAEKQDNG